MSTEAKYYRELGQELKDNHDLLMSGIDNLKEHFDGDAKWANEISATRDGKFLFWEYTENTSLVVPNDSDFIVPYPVTDSWFQNRYGGDWQVTGHERFVQALAIQAKEDLAKAEESAITLDHLNEEDVEALITIPTSLAAMIELARDGQTFFDTTKQAIADRADAKNKDKDYWVGSGSQAYVNALNLQIPFFGDAKDDMFTIEELCLALGDGVVDLAEAISKVYRERVDEWTEIIDTCISIASGPSNWATYASKLLNAVSDGLKKAAEEFEQKIKELAELEVTNTLVNKAKLIKMDNWISPAAGEFSS